MCGRFRNLSCVTCVGGLDSYLAKTTEKQESSKGAPKDGDPGVSYHLWPVFFGAELSGGVPGAGDSMKKSNLLAMLKHG